MVTQIPVFSGKETVTVERSLSFAERRCPEHYEYLKAAQEALDSLGRSVSQYPSITGTQTLRKRARSVETLAESLCNAGAKDRVLATPTRAVLGKAFLIAKIQFFALIRDMYDSRRFSGRHVPRVIDHLYANVVSLMSEDVFASILESSVASPQLRRSAAQQLASICE